MFQSNFVVHCYLDHSLDHRNLQCNMCICQYQMLEQNFPCILCIYRPQIQFYRIGRLHCSGCKCCFLFQSHHNCNLGELSRVINYYRVPNKPTGWNEHNGRAYSPNIHNKHIIIGHNNHTGVFCIVISILSSKVTHYGSTELIYFDHFKDWKF